jgi:molecular chaperone DnaK
MSDDEIDRAVKEAAEYEAQDKKRKEAIDAKNDADSFVFQTEKAIEEVGDKLDPADKANVEAELKNLKDLVEKCDAENMTEDQVVELKAAQEKAMTAAQKLFEKMYEKAQGAQGAGPDMSNMGGQAGPDMGASNNDSYDGDVVDGDYKEV